ncbi:hypothetical protein A2767_02945 [Candidatus Roizmanbacteria bacterium RIFCSPHIGHO2_01_FULL_35_10]|uniref:PIN domain-containing protein n=1 Tax=Candidatus Roizmanbacteria bacterium RIFCSPLOWO2_01_FULL_35_13 TaxID=1802055 RepID=A0A1F7ICM3_9BACT|nr:MAG: hypothetical protein A2767_02945 [Candidatus Roizmanbacteria bacterium RIFCSPHIGHO2_01_FULL_35_10]OGK41108.1 MAG: hypothetical protein A3A74_02070 [Candidatus Roizmanbacteria bacterium RIFCSPLOWO2_01_FULL_35_13]
MRVFIDTSAYFALFSKDDSNNDRVTKKLQFYKEIESKLFTSEFVLDELFTLLLKRYAKYIVKQAMEYFYEAETLGQIKIINIDRHLFRKTYDFFLKFSEHKISFTDAVSYVLCKDFKMDEIFTLDSDFKKLRLKTSF